MPAAGRDEIDLRPAPRVAARPPRRPGASAPTPSTRGCEAGNVAGPGSPSLPAAATTSVPDSCSARRHSTSAGRRRAVGRDVDDLHVAACGTSAKARDQVPRERLAAQSSDVDDARERERRVRARRPGRRRSGRFAPSRLATAVPWPTGSSRRGAVVKFLEREAVARAAEAVDVDARVGDAHGEAGGAARGQVDRLAPAWWRSSEWPPSSRTSSSRGEAARGRRTLDVAHAGRRAQARERPRGAASPAARRATRPSSRSSTCTCAPAARCRAAARSRLPAAPTTPSRRRGGEALTRPPRRPAASARAARAAVRDLVLRACAELGDRPLLALGHEERVVAEARVASLACGELALEPALDDELAPVGQHRGERAHERRARGPRRPAMRASSAALRSASSGPAKRAERMPGSPPSAATSMPESSPSPIVPAGASRAAARALSSALPAKCRRVSSTSTARASTSAPSRPRSSRPCARSWSRAARARRPMRVVATACSCLLRCAAMPRAPRARAGVERRAVERLALGGALHLDQAPAARP